MSSEDTIRVQQRLKALYKWAGLSNKTFWDWLQLLGKLAIPLAIVIGLGWFSTDLNQMEIAISESINEQHAHANLQIAQNEESDAILDSYLDHMSALLNNRLTHSKPPDEVREIARDQTLATLLRLDGARKGVVLQWLYQSGLIMKGNVIVRLSGANLSGAKLHGAELAGADLSGANLSGADLTNADLTATVLINTNLHRTTMPDGATNP